MDEAPLRELVAESVKYEAFAAGPSRASLLPTWSSPQQPQMVCRLIQEFLATPHILEHKTSGSENTKQIHFQPAE